MKKLLLSLVMMLFVFFVVKSYAAQGDIFATGQNEEFRVGAGGNVILSSDVVTTEGDPLIVTYIDLPTASSQTFTGTVGIALTTATLVSGGTTLVDGAAYSGNNQFTQIAHPRNVKAVISFYPGISGAGSAITATLTVYGRNAKNKEDSEVINISTNSASGSKAFMTISTQTVSGAAYAGTAASSCTIHIGTDNKISLIGDIKAADDVGKITIDGVDYSTGTAISGCVNASLNTIDLSKLIIPNSARDFIFWVITKVKH